MSTPLRLYAAGLFSKWGFGDGDCLGQWWWDTFDEPFPSKIAEHDVLTDLIERFLIPAIEAAGHTIGTYRIGTIHNPIRASTADDEPVDVYDGRIPDWADDIWVEFLPHDIKAIVA